MRLVLASLLLASAALGADKPAALQVCVKLPEGEALFAEGPRGSYRSIGNDAWLLDFDFTVNGHDVQRLTKSGPSCFRAWLPAEKVREVAFDFSRLPKNFVNVSVPMQVQLKPDLWSDGGDVTITRAAWASATNTTSGVLTLAWRGLSQADLTQLPAGPYTLQFAPAPQPKGACPIAFTVRASGTIRPDRNASLYKELVESYRREFLPELVARNKLLCDPAEEARITATLVDGAWRHPLSPRIERVRVEEKEPRYVVRIDGKALPFVEGMTVDLQPGQSLEFSEETLQAVR
jgi:hypothetical protein